MDKLVKIAKRQQIAVILVVHPRKNSFGADDNDSVSGSADITNKVDVVMTYKRGKDLPENERVLAVSKNRLTGKLAAGEKALILYYDEASKRISDNTGDFSRCYGWEADGDRKKTTMENGKIFENLIKICRCKELSVLFTPFKANCGLIRGKRIGVANDLNIDDINKTLAHEIAHLYLHKGKDILSIRNEEYEKQAAQAADMLLDILQIVICAQE